MNIPVRMTRGNSVNANGAGMVMGAILAVDTPAQIFRVTETKSSVYSIRTADSGI